MRDIQFRAWTGKEMFNIDVLAISPCTWDCPDYNKRGVSLAYQPHISVMQYTGLIDIKGNEIFDKDLLMDDEGFIWKVIYKQGAFYAECADLMAEQLLSSVNLYSRVIGNIYQKPKLVQS